MRRTEADRHRSAAADLNEILQAMGEVELNCLLDHEVLTLLEAKQEIEEAALRHCRDQHGRLHAGDHPADTDTDDAEVER
jgi:hypothetical protein